MLQKSLIRRLDLITLQLFVAVHEEGTLTRAAAREAIAVSAASKRLMELEEALGISLFVRQAKGMTLTPAGETLLHHARQMLFNVEKMGLELGEHSHGVRGYVRMLANLSAIIQFLPEDLRDFSAQHPQVKTDLEERPSAGVIQGVLDGVADLGICSNDSDTKGLHSVLYRQDKLVVRDAARNILWRRVRPWRSPKPWTAITSVCTPPVRSTCAPTRRRGRLAKSCVFAFMCRGSMRCAGWSRPTWASAFCRSVPMNCLVRHWGCTRCR